MEKQRAWYRLSAAFVANATAPGRRFHDGGGLYLVVRKNGTRDWLLKYQRNGTARGMGLGSLRTTSLSLAREKADAARRLFAGGRRSHRAPQAGAPPRSRRHRATENRARSQPRSISQARGALVEREAQARMEVVAGPLRPIR